jgi:hypothetical protein
MRHRYYLEYFFGEVRVGVDKNIRFVILIMLNKVSIEMCSWSGCNILAQHPGSINFCVKLKMEKSNLEEDKPYKLTTFSSL